MIEDTRCILDGDLDNEDISSNPGRKPAITITLISKLQNLERYYSSVTAVYGDGSVASATSPCVREVYNSLNHEVKDSHEIVLDKAVDGDPTAFVADVSGRERGKGMTVQVSNKKRNAEEE